jgi:general secretion pathway protein I
MKAARAQQAGFTLLEVLVALAILSLAVVASIQGFAQGLRLLKLSGDHQQAMLLADQKVREMVEPVEGQDGGTEGPFRWERIARPIPTPDLMPPGGIPRGRLYEIDVRVTWDPRREVEVRTLRMTSTLTATGAPKTTTSPNTPASSTTSTSPATSALPTRPSTPFGGPGGPGSTSR